MPRSRACDGAGAGTVREHDLKVLVAAFGDPGHVFPALALGREAKGRGHDVIVETWGQWRDVVAAEGLGFRPSEQYQAYPPPPPDSSASAAQAARGMLRLLHEDAPDVVVNDILTLAPALAADAAEIPRATLIPHLYPVTEATDPFFASGFQRPRTESGKAAWRLVAPVLERGLRRGRSEWNQMRAELGLDPQPWLHAGHSRRLTLVATFPQLEYPRTWPEYVHVVGPLTYQTPHPEIELPPGDDPLVLVAPSTSQDPDNQLVRAALEGLAGQDVRVLATTNRVVPQRPIDVPSNARLVDWVSYDQVIPAASAVVSHGGHGTIARCLGAGVPVLVIPAAGDMSETAARIEWSGTGLSVPWRFNGPRSLRWALRDLMADPSYTESALTCQRWLSDADPARTAVELVEQSASGVEREISA